MPHSAPSHLLQPRMLHNFSAYDTLAAIYIKLKMLAWGFCGYYVSGWVSSVGLKGLLLGPSVLIQKTWCVSLVGSILILVLSSSFYLFCYYFPACKCNP